VDDGDDVDNEVLDVEETRTRAEVFEEIGCLGFEMVVRGGGRLIGWVLGRVGGGGP
jgi:hypothetical protein